MTQRLPSLNALRAFEAAARHRSLTNAARELNVTPAAISHQVKALEADLGIGLLRRIKGEFQLSETARAALPGLRAGFDQIAEAARRLRGDDADRFLTISVGATFATTWLVRRIGNFTESFPDIDVRLQTTDRLADFARDGVDVGIRFGRGVYPSDSVAGFTPDANPFAYSMKRYFPSAAPTSRPENRRSQPRRTWRHARSCMSTGRGVGAARPSIGRCGSGPPARGASITHAACV
jgi:LysR family glycine cleavage system transcriptional activator